MRVWFYPSHYLGGSLRVPEGSWSHALSRLPTGPLGGIPGTGVNSLGSPDEEISFRLRQAQDWGGGGRQLVLRAAHRGRSRAVAEGLPALGCNSPDLSSSGSSSRAGMWGCLMFSGSVVGRALVSGGRSSP